jgi:hypothetical protein
MSKAIRPTARKTLDSVPVLLFTHRPVTG